MPKTDPRSGIPILSRREMKRLALGELADYQMRILNYHDRSQALQDVLEQTNPIMLETQRKLYEAESMPRTERYAQPGYIYLVGGNNVYKIGKSKDIPSRLRAFLQLPFRTHLIHSIPTSDMVWAEAYIHQAFAHCRLNGEWFDLLPTEVAWICHLQGLDPG